MSLEEMKYTIIGIPNATFSAKSQLVSSSYDKFQLIPYYGKLNNYEAIADGVAEVNLGKNIIGEETGSIENAMLAAAYEKYGDIESQIDLILLFVPEGTKLAGTSDWKAYAFTNNWLSVYNNEYTSFPGIIMHEIGHNIGLLHSNDEFSYGDGSCLMGASPTKVDGPHMCYNSAKSWQLRWYDDSNLVLNAEDIVDNLYQLIGVAEYSMITATDDYVIIKVTKCADRYNYFINFNRKVGITADSSEGENNVLIIRLSRFSIDCEIGEGEEYITKALKGGKLIAMHFKSLSFDSLPVHASVRISQYPKCRSDSNCNDYDPCTTSKCINYDRYGDGICEFSEVSCNLCGTKIVMNSTTNEYADSLLWEIINTDYNRIFMSSETNLSPHTTRYYTESKCLPFGEYSLVATYSENQTKSENVSYSLQTANDLTYDRYSNEYFE